jgi:serine/threonine-protein kinase
MGAVYKALDQKLNRIVALKVVHPHLSGDPSFLKRFLREARDMARLPHENIVTIFSVEQDHDTHFLVMEYFPGTNLRDMISSDGAAPLWKAVSITRQIANALSYAHRHGIIHRDIKPANVLVASDNRAKLTDFGIAAALDHAPLTSTGQIIGSLPYMPPEQARDATLDGRSDLYSLGMTFYELLTGSNPRRNLSNTAILSMLLSEDKMSSVEFPASIPSEIQDIVKNLLKYRPTDRIQDADTLLECLEALRPIWSRSSTGDKPSGDAPTIVKSIRQQTEDLAPIRDDKTVAVLDPRLASRPSPPASQKRQEPKRKINTGRLMYASSLTILFFGLGIGGYYFWITQDLAPDKGTLDKVVAIPTPPENVSEAAPKQSPSVENSSTQPSGQPAKSSSPTKPPDIKDKTSIEKPASSKTPPQGTMPRQKSNETVDNVANKNSVAAQNGRPPVKSPDQNTKRLTEKPSTQKMPPQTSMPAPKSNETDKTPAGNNVGEQAEAKVAMALKSAAETQALMDLLNRLRTVIVQKDLPAVERMSILSEPRRRLLEEMFESYASIEASIDEVKKGPTEAKAVLLINKLVLPGGEAIDPVPLVRRTPITIMREGDDWGRVIW